MNCLFWSQKLTNVFVFHKKEFNVWTKPEIKHILKQKGRQSDFEIKHQLLSDDFLELKVMDQSVEIKTQQIISGKVEELRKCDEISDNNKHLNGLNNGSHIMYPHEDETKWFLPKCDRKNAERLLKGRRDGTFLVRSSAQLEDKYVLSIVIKGHVKHIVIQKSSDGYFLYSNHKHPTLFSLIMFYAQPFDYQINVSVESCQNLYFPVFD
ncbi:phosphatidylinositol 3-kinase regulatory subunit gamma-like [Oppia nitens]|uniref:phosphatidylinositol 3-kinase regulatory subunit gamma-like n=1 Tax=Oppia nitens TaxID=1686743 RepID=UPI0023DA1980|nr:phosphatidylinositol 3-kinase regulatory subunit gamma-like [Oppia nitens]